MASADDRLLTGKGFGPFKKMLMAKPAALADYRKMVGSAAFKHPIRYAEIDEFFRVKLVGAICHGTALTARSINRRNGRSVIYDYKTTFLLKTQKMAAYYHTALWLKGLLSNLFDYCRR